MLVETSDNPIFILGILPRSGTNFLFHLLRLHPDCVAAESIWEDHLLEFSGPLLQYGRAVYEWWEVSWGLDKSFQAALWRHLGQGLISFLKSQAGEGRLVTKTPEVSGLESFFQLFPDAYLLILVRDGRDVVESSVRSFGWDHDVTTRRWVEAAQTILAFDQANRQRGLPYLIIRYEDLYLDPEKELNRILAFVKLDVVIYDFEAARELPVYGSCAFGRTGDKVQLRGPVTKTPEFNPIGRWSGWSRRMHERFNWLAGRYLVEFGYEPRTESGHQPAWVLYNKAVDAVGKHRPYRFVPPFAWKLIKKAAYKVSNLLGVDTSDRAYQVTRLS